jgi:hypothetical protein
MKKLLIPLLIFIFTSCDYSLTPDDQDGTIWVCDNPQMYFTVEKSREPRSSGVLVLNNENIKIVVYGGGGQGMEVVFRDNDDVNVLFDGGLNNGFKDNGFSQKNKYILTVRNSEVDSIEKGDVIVFNRVDELPDWALEMESEASAEASDSS